MQQSKSIKAFIVDDELDAIQALQGILTYACPQIQIVGTAQNITEAFRKINETLPELVFLDIDINGTTSFELLNLYENVPFKIIFVTGHDEYALKAIKYAALDYILKPINSVELTLAVKRVNEYFHTNGVPMLRNALDEKYVTTKIALKVGYEVNIILIANIVCAESDGNFTYVHLINGTSLYVSQSIKELELLLADKNFYRLHRSYLINMMQIKHYNQTIGAEVTLTSNKTVPISVRKKQEFLTLAARFYSA
ncbi:MAG: LytTR family DNA-binding domain-containing protein [Bacteroidia bacterium]